MSSASPWIACGDAAEESDEETAAVEETTESEEAAEETAEPARPTVENGDAELGPGGTHFQRLADRVGGQAEPGGGEQDGAERLAGAQVVDRCVGAGGQDRHDRPVGLPGAQLALPLFRIGEVQVPSKETTRPRSS